MTDSRLSRHVYRTGAGPAVVLMHELGGLAPVTLRLAEEMADEGYTVFLPLFFGSFGQDSQAKGFVQLCVRREFVKLAFGRRSEITDWVRHLARWANHETGERGVAAIGMCATGGLVFGMMLEDDVAAAVASQPSMPFAFPFCLESVKRSVGMSGDKLSRIRDKPLLALRFERDWICPRERMHTIRECFGDSSVLEIPEDGDYESARPPIPRRAHSVLTYDRESNPGHPTQEAAELVRAFLRMHLPPQASGQR